MHPARFTHNSLQMAYKKILVIDDDTDDQEIFLTAMASVSGEVECSTASSGIEALARLSEGKLTTDLIFLDLNMPIMSGQQFLQEIKKRNDLAHIPVIIFTTSSHWQTIQMTKDLGAADFITKPGKFSELVNLLSNIIN